jgi:hypothetical protein
VLFHKLIIKQAPATQTSNAEHGTHAFGAVRMCYNGVTDSIKGRKNAWKKRTGDWLRVTYTVVENVNIVVTVTVKRKFSKEGDGSEN